MARAMSIFFFAWAVVKARQISRKIKEKSCQFSHVLIALCLITSYLWRAKRALKGEVLRIDAHDHMHGRFYGLNLIKVMVVLETSHSGR